MFYVIYNIFLEIFLFLNSFWLVHFLSISFTFFISIHFSFDGSVIILSSCKQSYSFWECSNPPAQSEPYFWILSHLECILWLGYLNFLNISSYNWKKKIKLKMCPSLLPIWMLFVKFWVIWERMRKFVKWIWKFQLWCFFFWKIIRKMFFFSLNPWKKGQVFWGKTWPGFLFSRKG